jgi:hypothetical protein
MPFVWVLHPILACSLYALAELTYLVRSEIIIDAVVIIRGDWAPIYRESFWL